MTAFMITHMGLLSGMCSRMDRQRTALDETLIAILDGAMIGAFIGVYSIMPAEV